MNRRWFGKLMWRSAGWTVVLLLIAVSARSGFGQSESLIDREIDALLEGSLWMFGPFRLTPSLRLGAGYDSNGLSAAEFPEPDFTVRVAPGLRAVTPILDRAFFEIEEQVHFVYYRELEDLRDIYGETRVGAGVGGDKLLFRVEDDFLERKARSTSEYDVPVDQKENRFRATLAMALGWRHELELSYQNSLTRILDPDATFEGRSVQDLLSRTEHDYRLRFSRHLTTKTTAVADGFYDILDFDEDAVGRDAGEWGAVGGFVFRPRTNVTGQALLGYKWVRPDVVTQAAFSGITGSVDVGMRLGERLGPRVLYSRDVIPSVLRNNWFFIENRVGGSVEIFVWRSFSVRPGVIAGRNTYPRPETVLNDAGELVEVDVFDRFETYSLSLDYHVAKDWTVGVVANYLSRESNYLTFSKDRLTVSFALNEGF